MQYAFREMQEVFLLCAVVNQRIINKFGEDFLGKAYSTDSIGGRCLIGAQIEGVSLNKNS